MDDRRPSTASPFDAEALVEFIRVRRARARSLDELEELELDETDETLDREAPTPVRTARRRTNLHAALLSVGLATGLSILVLAAALVLRLVLTA